MTAERDALADDQAYRLANEVMARWPVPTIGMYAAMVRAGYRAALAAPAPMTAPPRQPTSADVTDGINEAFGGEPPALDKWARYLWASGYRKAASMFASLRELVAERDRLHTEFVRECDDADKICRALNLPGSWRTDGGSLHLPRILGAIAALRAENERQAREIADFHMAYRMKCDEQTKAALQRAERAEADCDALWEVVKAADAAIASCNALIGSKKLWDAYDAARGKVKP